MADIKLTIPDEIAPRVLAGFCGQFGYQETLEIDKVVVPNPESRAAFAQRMLYQVIKDCVKAFEANQAVESARLSAVASTEKDIKLQ